MAAQSKQTKKKIPTIPLLQRSVQYTEEYPLHSSAEEAVP